MLQHCAAKWRFGLAVSISARSYSTPKLVSAGMGDCLGA